MPYYLLSHPASPNLYIVPTRKIAHDFEKWHFQIRTIRTWSMTPLIYSPPDASTRPSLHDLWLKARIMHLNDSNLRRLGRWIRETRREQGLVLEARTAANILAAMKTSEECGGRDGVLRVIFSFIDEDETDRRKRRDLVGEERSRGELRSIDAMVSPLR
jgi:hypothetical protein